MQDAGTDDDVERARPEARSIQIGFDKLYTIKPKATRGGRSQQQR